VHLYSTFAQRGYDQIIHDVALQNLPVVFVLDRAGLVGEDGATHHGAFDLAFLNPIPNLQILAPMDGAELKSMLAYAFAKNSPVVIRYPRGGEQHKSTEVYAIKTSSFRILKDGEKVVVVSLGTIGKMVQQAVQDLPVGHIDLRFLKPWDDGALEAALQPYQYIISIEDGNMRGGLRDSLATWLMQHAPAKKLYGMGLPDHFIQHGSIKELNQELGFNEEALQKLLNQLIGC
jgi:1-deoxy-D-xylulose-5-phosphate synthase